MIGTRVPYAVSVELLRVRAASPGSSVVTSTSKGAKSSATRCHTLWTVSCSACDQVPGLPSMSKAG